MTPRPRAPITVLIREAKRELRKRHDVYPGLVQRSGLTQARADQLIAWQEDIISVLEQVQHEQQLDLFAPITAEVPR